jgi:hypothetical protein
MRGEGRRLASFSGPRAGALKGTEGGAHAVKVKNRTLEIEGCGTQEKTNAKSRLEGGVVG